MLRTLGLARLGSEDRKDVEGCFQLLAAALTRTTVILAMVTTTATIATAVMLAFV